VIQTQRQKQKNPNQNNKFRTQPHEAFHSCGRKRHGKPKRATIGPSTSKSMEDFLTNLDNLVDSLENVTAIEVIGALELVKQRLVFDLLADDEDEQEDAE